jgi:hypothetical protein
MKFLISIPSPMSEIPNDELIGVTTDITATTSKVVEMTTVTRADPTPSADKRRGNAKVGSTVDTPSNISPQSKMVESCNDLRGIDHIGKGNGVC